MKITGKGVAISPKSSDNIGVVSEIYETAIKAAYEAGKASGREWGIQLGIEMGMKRAMETTSRDLHNFKFPDSQRPIDMPLEQHAPKDDSTFEFTYKTYAERVAEQDAENNRKRRANRLVAMNRRNRK